MAASRKKTRRVRVEMSVSGFMGTLLVCFCIFVWLFLLGVWVGQSVLMPSAGNTSSASIARIATRLWQAKNDFGTPKTIEAVSKKESADSPVQSDPGERTEAEDSFFSIQVAAFKDEKNAVKAVLQWRARGYESFFLKPEKPNHTFHRVFIGRYDELVDANVATGELAEQTKEKVFITLVPKAQKQYP